MLQRGGGALQTFGGVVVPLSGAAQARHMKTV
jgi:hypothetical protein